MARIPDDARRPLPAVVLVHEGRRPDFWGSVAAWLAEKGFAPGRR